MTKKITSLVLAVLLALSMIAMPALAASISTTVKTTNKGDVLNVRKGPHKGNTPVVDYVQNGTKITLMTTNNKNDPEAWNKIKVNKTGAVGYLKNKYIKYFGLNNADGEVDPDEDDDWNYRDSDDNDGKRGNGTAAGGGGSGVKTTALKYGEVSCRIGGSVNIRSGAGTSHKAVGTGKLGDYLDVLGAKGDWYKVKFQGKNLTGFIHKDYFTEGIIASIRGNGVNMRKGAGTGYAVVRTLKAGEEVRVLSESGSWSRVKYGTDTVGYVYSSYVYWQ